MTSDAMPTSQLASMLSAQIFNYYVPNPAGVLAWYNADSLALSNHANVSTWTDLSVNGNNLTVFGTGHPQYNANGLNGHAAVTFGLNTAGLQITSLAVDSTHPYSIWIMFYPNSVSGTQVITSSYGQNFPGLQIADGEFVMEGNGTSFGGGSPNTAPHYAGCVYTSSTSGTLLIDGVVIGSSDIGTAITAGFSLGNNSGSGAVFMGDIYEVIVLDSGNMHPFDYYFTTKYAL